MNEGEATGKRVLKVVITLAGLSIIIFGGAQIAARQYLTGVIILIIGISDFVMMFLFLRYLKK